MNIFTLVKKTAAIFFLLILAFFPFQLEAQKKIGTTQVRPDKAPSLSHVFKKYSLFTVDTKELAQYATLNKGKNVNIELEVAGLPSLNMVLQETDILSSGYKMITTTQSGRKVAERPNCKTYQGKLAGDYNSQV